METVQFRAMAWDVNDKLIYDTIQEIPNDGKYHWSKVVKENINEFRKATLKTT